MTKQDEERISEIVVDAIKDVVLPVLEDHSNKLNGLTRDVGYLKDRVDSHTASLMELEVLPSLLGKYITR